MFCKYLNWQRRIRPSPWSGPKGRKGSLQVGLRQDSTAGQKCQDLCLTFTAGIGSDALHAEGAAPASDAGAWNMQGRQLERDDRHEVREAKTNRTLFGQHQTEKEQVDPFRSLVRGEG